ncbi:MAG: enoyl-CoA hydratase/isomerase family protein [Actinobacteria bacterium]|nr:enoyl-CoA hydratase/isomerase family protein [Actinomycetota bacterium]
MDAAGTDVTLTREGDVFILHLGDGENRFDLPQITALRSALAEVEATQGARALVTTAGGKFWSNGLDLDWLGDHPDEAMGALEQFHHLLAETLGGSVFTVAAIQGHAFAAGAMFAAAHDIAVMREDRGFWCVPEIDLLMPFTPGMSALLQGRLPHRTAHVAMTTGRRYTGPQAVEAGIVDEVAPEGQVRERAVELATGLAAKDAGTLRAIKRRMYAGAIEALEAAEMR